MQGGGAAVRSACGGGAATPFFLEELPPAHGLEVPLPLFLKASLLLFPVPEDGGRVRGGGGGVGERLRRAHRSGNGMARWIQTRRGKEHRVREQCQIKEQCQCCAGVKVGAI